MEENSNEENPTIEPKVVAKEETIGIAKTEVDQVPRSSFGPGIEYTIEEAKRAAELGFMVTHKKLIEGFFVFAQIPSFVSKDFIPKMSSLPQSVKDEFRKRASDQLFTGIQYKNQFAIVTKDNIIQSFNFELLEILKEGWIIL